MYDSIASACIDITEGDDGTPPNSLSALERSALFLSGLETENFLYPLFFK